ncbi:MAG: hypothetical protein JKY56_14750 [Kofleriaceae bacterium]|nr:hypothetical protein [Kofleriaceae bacterium]
MKRLNATPSQLCSLRQILMIGVLATLGCDGESSDSLPNDSGQSADSQSNDCVEANNCCSGDIASDGLGYIRLPLQLPTVQQLPSDSVIGVVEEIGVWPDDDTASFLRVSGQQVYLPFTLAEVEHIDDGPALKVEVTVEGGELPGDSFTYNVRVTEEESGALVLRSFTSLSEVPAPLPLITDPQLSIDFTLDCQAQINECARHERAFSLSIGLESTTVVVAPGSTESFTMRTGQYSINNRKIADWVTTSNLICADGRFNTVAFSVLRAP